MLGLVSLLALVTAVTAAPERVDRSEMATYTPARVTWKELVYRASKLGVRADSEIEIRLLPTPEASSALIAADEGAAVLPRGDQVAEIVIVTHVRGTDSTTRLLLDPASAAAFQRSQLVEGGKKRSSLRTYRYLEDGVYVERRFAPDGAAPGPPTGWPVRNTRTIEFPAEAAGRGVSEATALFYILSAADLAEVGDRVSFLNFDRPDVSEVVMTLEETVPWKVSYTEASSAGERRVREERPVARLTLAGEALGDKGRFEFLGLRGEIEIFMDPDLRIPLAVRGKVPVVGKTTVEVDRVVLE